MLSTQRHQLHPAFGVHGHGRRILERWNRVQHDWAMLRKRLLQRVDAQPMLVNRNAYHIQTVIAKDQQREKIGGLLDKDGIARLGESRTNQIKGLRCTGGNQQAVKIDRRVVTTCKKLRERLTEIVIAVISTVLQNRSVAGGQRVIGCGSQSVQRELGKRGLPNAQVDHALRNVRVSSLQDSHR